MAKGRKRPASAIEEDRRPALSANGKATTSAGGDGGASKSLETTTTTTTTSNNEVKFGKHLASSDKRVRDRTVAALREWLRQRSKGGALTDLDLLKIWRGLWYCMFMCDKAPVQRELAENLAGLLSLFKDDREEGVRFFRSFCVTMQRDWERIDNLRIDKYYTLVRVFVREALAFCRVPVASPTPSKRKKKGKKNSPAAAAAAAVDQDEHAAVSAASDQNAAGGASAEWDLALIGAMSGVMEDEVLTLHPAPIGLRLHLADVWAEEACNAGGEDMPTEAFLVALAPWLRAAAHPETNAVVFRRTFEGVLEGLLDFFPEEDGDEMNTGEEEEEEKKVFKTVELDQVQACLFEVAAAPQTRQKRRAKLYELHRRYQKRTGVAPDASAPPSGILPLPEDSESDSDDEEEGDYDGEYVEAGARPRAVRGPEPPVTGWVAAGIAAGAISRDGDGDGDGGGGQQEGRAGVEEEGGAKVVKKRRKRSDSVEAEEEKETGGQEEGRQKPSKKKRRSAGSAEVDDGESGVEEEEGSAKKKGKKKKRASIESEAAAAAEVAAADTPSKAETPSKKGSKKRKKEEASLDDDGPTGGEGGQAASDGGGAMSASSSPPSSGKRKSKKKRRGSTDGVGAETPQEIDAIAVAEAAAAAAAVEVSTPPSGKKKKKKKSKEGVEEGAATPDNAVEMEAASEEAAALDSSAEKKKKKKKKRSSLEGGAASPTSPAGAASSVVVPEPSSESFHTPPKTGGKQAGSSGKKKKKKSPAAVESARKTVTFGADMEKDHVTSVKDLKTRVITPSKNAGTPQKGLLKVGGGGSGVKPMKPTAQRKDTPYLNKKKKASDFF